MATNAAAWHLLVAWTDCGSVASDSRVRRLGVASTIDLLPHPYCAVLRFHVLDDVGHTVHQSHSLSLLYTPCNHSLSQHNSSSAARHFNSFSTALSTSFFTR